MRYSSMARLLGTLFFPSAIGMRYATDFLKSFLVPVTVSSNPMDAMAAIMFGKSLETFPASIQLANVHLELHTGWDPHIECTESRHDAAVDV